MEDKIAICKMFGLTQKEIAERLKVSRSQWSMFELGKRSLPAEAELLLAEMLTHLEAAKMTTRLSRATKETDKNREALEELLLENKFQLDTITRKIAAVIRKRSVVEGKIHFANFRLGNDASEKAADERKVQPFNQVDEWKETKILKQLVKYDIRREVLKFEEQLIQKRLREE